MDKPRFVLSVQERAVLELLADGLTNKEIAARRGLKVKTVEQIVTSILLVLGVGNRTEAAILARGGRIAHHSEN